MKKAGLFSAMAIFCSIYSDYALAIEEQIFNLRGDAPLEVILEKIGAPKSPSFPLVLKNNEREIKVDLQGKTERQISIEFTPAHPFTVSDQDRFEKIESSKTGDQVHRDLIVADPQTGRIWKLNTELNVSEFDLIAPWASKSKLLSLKEIMKEMSQHKIQKKTNKKTEVKK